MITHGTWKRLLFLLWLLAGTLCSHPRVVAGQCPQVAACASSDSSCSLAHCPPNIAAELERYEWQCDYALVAGYVEGYQVQPRGKPARWVEPAPLWDPKLSRRECWPREGQTRIYRYRAVTRDGDVLAWSEPIAITGGKTLCGNASGVVPCV